MPADSNAFLSAEIRHGPGEVNQLQDLLLSVNQRHSVTSADLSFASSSLMELADGSVISRENRQALLVALLTVIVNKGCERLVVDGGIDTREVPVVVVPPPSDASWRRFSFAQGARDTLARFTKRSVHGAGPAEPGPREDRPPASHVTVPDGVVLGSLEPVLATFHLASQILFSSSLLDWTICLLNSSSATLSTLKLSSSATPYGQWLSLFRSVTLPALVGLSICTHSDSDIANCDHTKPRFPNYNFVLFLARHPTIKRLDLEHHRPGAPSKEVVRTLSMPALEEFTGHADHASWLAELFPHRLPRLRTFVTTTSYKTWRYELDADRYVCDDALEKLANGDRRDADDPPSPLDQDLTLGFNFRATDCADAEQFLCDHASETHDAGRVVRSLQRIRALQLEFKRDVSWDREMLVLVAGFINTFPGVVRVEFVDLRARLGDPSCYVPTEESLPLRDSDRTVREFFEDQCPKLGVIRFVQRQAGQMNDSETMESRSVIRTKARTVEPGPPE